MSNEDQIKKLLGKIDDLSCNIEKINLAEYVEILRNPKRLLYLNFLSGMARGFGMAVGFTLLGAMLIYILQKIMILRLPLIGEFIAEIVNIVQQRLSIM
ncbi:MAG TPA: hypothetical protein GX534_06360 [Thermoanaerobacterales bacterium]|jgi:hypothetical protein|nr:hypothetical protein [Thermoanaerobacterales bacterium]